MITINFNSYLNITKALSVCSSVETVFYMKHSEYFINRVMNYGYTREEAINILDGKNADGSDFIELPF